ncbi:Por secretion system C-terminal sorting domain-containing protein [Salinimicrobium sediminis]|uniref:Por secretion system C-terminal sorting domain-containing protein n=1 Tax=Salinimicrobium sediminis TaxID=1343891 RepID=A0A285X086_9FLAO|nr:T9SS type A sorting domain-containing protein [Salinimicrobium sediminis]SOC78708.1 Por secretion system C-terminal sorting domain-containing protein [Salinimicrobium sediminis]
MVKKLLLKVLTFWALLLTSALGWGQCPTSVSISSSAGNTICADTEVTFTANPNGGSGTFSFQWKVDGANAGTNSPEFTTSALSNGDKVTVTVTSTDSTTCSTTSSAYTMTVNSNKTPTVTISANKSSICPGDSVIFTASNTNGGTSPQYDFFLNNNTTPLQSGSSNTFTSTSLTNGDQIRVVLTSSLECVTSSTDEITSNQITVRAGIPATPAAITTPGSTICPGTSQTYSIAAVTGASSYQWTLPSGWTGSSSSTSITATAGTSGGTVSVKAVNDCGVGEAQTIDITVKAGTPAVPGNITGETAVCPGVSQTYSIGAVPEATEYIWTLPGGWSGTSTTNSINVTTGASGSGNISVQAKNDCGTSTAKTLAVSVKAGTPAQPGTISGTAAVCPGVSETYAINAVTGATSYEWTLPDTSWTGTSTTNSITVTTGTTNGDITVKAINDCGTSVVQTFAVTVKPGTPPTPASIFGSDIVCPGTSETYSITPIDGATEYIWTLPSGWTGNSTTEEITVTTAQSGSGTITVKAKNDCGTGPAASFAVSVDKPAPVMSGTITGPAEVCSTATNLVYSIPAITNATDYIWTLPSGWSITSGTGSNSITVSATSSSGNISVMAKNTCGDSSPSANFVVNSVSGAPATPGAISTSLPSTAICPPVNNQTFSVTPVSGATGYNWILPAGWEITSGANTSSITVNITAAQTYASPTTVKVEATNICGKSAVSTSQDIFLDNYIVANIGPDLTVCKIVNSIPQLSLQGTMNFGNSNLSPTFKTSGTGTFQNVPSNKKGDFTVNYTPSAADYQLGQVKITMTIPKITTGNSPSCGTGVDEMLINFKDLPTAAISSTGPICSGTTSVLTFTGTPNSRVTYKLPNNSTATVDIGASGSADVTTAALTANATYSLVSAINLDTPACSKALTGSTTVTVTPKPTASITYSGAPFCTSLTTGQSPTLTGTEAYTGGTYSSTPGLSIDSASGAITPSSSTPGTYTVTYSTPEGGGCTPVTTTTQVTITKQPTASITYSGTPFCTSDSVAKTVTLTGTDSFTGGSFTASPEGLSIDSGTGAITASSSTAGTYTVTYETPTAGGCSPVQATTEVVITKAPTVTTFTYPDAPFCMDETSEKQPLLEGTDAFSGGNYTVDKTGLSIDSSTGAINPGASSVGIYTITYTTPATGGCNEVTATTEISITETPFVEISYAGPFCTSDATPQVVNFTNGVGAYEGGTFSSSPGGLNIDPETGNITGQGTSPGTYVVNYTIPATSGCDEVVVNTEVKITQLPQVSISYDTPFCNSDATVYPVKFGSTAGDYSGGVFTATNGLDIDAEGNINPQNSTAGIHTVTYTKDTADDGCAVVEATTKIEIFEKVIITTQPVNFGTCSSNPASFEVVATGDDLIYQWYKKDAGGTFVKINGETNSILSFNNATSANAGEYHVVVSSSNAVCSSETSDPVTLNIDEDIIIIKPAEDITICENDVTTMSFEYEAHANGAELIFQWIKDGVEINPTSGKYVMEATGPEGENGVYTGVLTIQNIDVSDDGVYAVRINGPESFTCPEATSKSFTFRVNPRPGPPVTTAVEYCLNETPSALTATKASEENELLWYTHDTATDEYIYLGTSITPNTDTSGQTSYWVSQKQPNSCESDKTELVVTVYDKPAPIATETIQFSYCFNETVTDPISITPTEGSTINWYDSEASTTALSSAPTANTSEAKLTSYWVSQTLTSTGCESDRTKVDIIINELPNVNIAVAEGYSAEFCKGSEIKLVASGANSYIWYDGENEIGNTSEITILGESAGTFEYKVVGTDDNGCVNQNVITIKVEEPTEGGNVSGPSSVCETQNEGTLTVADFKGEIQRWESSIDGINWTSIAGTSETLDFQNISGTTTFRAIVKNGVCAEVPSTEISVSVDPVPIGGELAFAGFGRTIETCSNPGPDYNIPLSLTGQEGEIIRWRYKEGSATNWSYVMEGEEYFTGTTLSPELIRSLGINQSTIFEVEITSGACTPNAISQNATLGIVSSDIAPNPVTVTPGVVCIGELVTLSGSTGYGSGPGFEEGGSFDFSSITNKGWRIKDKNGVESNFDSSADNGVAAIWLRTNPLPLTTSNLNTGSLYTQNWDSSAGNEGNKGFAIVSGPNESTMETSVFNLFAVEDPVLTFDQAYNLAPGSAIYVDISTDGGATYNPVPLFELIATNATDGSSGFYDSFGDDAPGNRDKNKIVLDLTDYASMPNLRIRFRYEGKKAGDVWAVDAISLPVEPTNVDLTWTDYTDPENPIVIGTDNSEQWAPKLVGWNDFEIRTRLTFDSTGQQCPVVENWKTISVFVFDQYTSTASAVAGSCGSNNVQLNGEIVNSTSTLVTEFPTRDDYSARWEVVTGPTGYTFSEAHFTNGDSTTPAVNDPQAIFSPGMFGSYTLRWALNRSADDDLTNETCPPIYTDVTIDINDCTALDFDGVDDYVDLGNNYQGSFFMEAWIRPFARPLPDGSGNTNPAAGTIISGRGFELTMSDLSTKITPGTRWYHIAVSNTGQLWVDGISSGTVSLNGHGGNRTIIGAKWDPSAKEAKNHYSGWIEEVRIWSKELNEEQIRFMMNQRLISNGAKMGEQIPMEVPDGLTYSDLAGYYRLISADPEPLDVSPVVYLAEDMPANGLTPDRATTKVPGRLMNMETNQENTAPLPYYSGNNGVWGTDATWLRPDVWDPPHTGEIEWNIVRTSHNITSGSRDIKLLGLISEVNALDMEGQNPPTWTGGGGSGNQLFLSHYLLLNGIIDLNGQSQLLQPMGSIVDASSGGHLDRDQQGTASSYNYNYWVSPVGPDGSNSAYSVGAVMMDGSSQTPQSLDFGAAYAHADGGPATPRKVSEYWLHKFHGTANDYFTWDHIGSTGKMNAGEGYSMKGTAGTAGILDSQNYTFRGLPNNGDITPGSTGPEQNYLIGNPYPSAIDANKFINDNLNVVGGGNTNVFNGTVYFWSHFANQTHYLQEYIGGYAAYNLSGGVLAAAVDERINATDEDGGQVPQQFIPVGQAFFVNTMLDPSLVGAMQDAGLPDVTGGPVIFKNSQRAFVLENQDNGGSVFHSQEKKRAATSTTNNSSSQEVEQNKIWLKFKSPKGYHRQILVTADQRATENFDLGFDAPMIDENVEDMYWYFNKYQFVIQGVPDFNIERVLDLGINVEQKGALSISIDDLDNIPDEMNIYLADSLNQVVHDLRAEPYETESEAGTFTDRFKLVFQDKTQIEEPDVPIIEEGPFEVLYVTGTRNVLLRNPELLEVDRVYLNNMLGQQVHVYYNVPSEKEVELPVKRFAAGVYIVKVHYEGGIITRKVILE